MSADDKAATCSSDNRYTVDNVAREATQIAQSELCKESKKPSRKVSFPEDDQIVTQYFEPPNPWQDVPATSRAQLAAEYLESCRRHRTPAIDTVLEQIRELPENTIGGCARAPRLRLAECTLLGAAPADALEALLRKVQFRRLEVDRVAVDDEGAEALFDMVEYYESANVVSLNGERQFGIRGWQAACRMVKKSWSVCELEASGCTLEAGHATVVARALHAPACRLRSLSLPRCSLAGDALLCLVIALKSNNSVRELRLGDNRLTASDAAQLGSLLRYNSRLQLLDLSNNMIQDAGAGHLCESLGEQARWGAATPPSAAASPLSPLSPYGRDHCEDRGAGGGEPRGLSVLVLWNNQLTRNCAPHLARAVLSQSLCVLNVGRNALGGEAVRALAGGALLSLGLQAARLGPDAARPLADLVRTDTKLQRLDLRENRLGAAGLTLVATALRDNRTLTQLDLDEPPAQEAIRSLTAEQHEAAAVARLVREVRALCKRNEPAATPDSRRPHRKISLTCHTAGQYKSSPPEDEPRASSASAMGARLRSPAPSPAGSPVPHQHHRFSVSRVPPEREPVPPRAAPSRFRVVQVAEPPKIQVYAAEPRRSRFSVTRNYDASYSCSPTSPPATTAAHTEPTATTAAHSEGTVIVVAGEPPAAKTVDQTLPEVKLTSDVETEVSQVSQATVDPKVPGDSKGHSDKIDQNKGDDVTDIKISDSGNTSKEKTATVVSESDNVKCDGVGQDVKVDVVSDVGAEGSDSDAKGSEGDAKSSEGDAKSSEGDAKGSDSDAKSSDSDAKGKDSDAKGSDSDSHAKGSDNHAKGCDSEAKGSDSEAKYQDEGEQVSHEEVVDDDVLKTETKIVKNKTKVSETEKVDMHVEVTVKTESVKPAKVHNDQNEASEAKDIDDGKEKDEDKAKPDDVRTIKQIEAITEDLSNLIQEMKELSTKTGALTKKEVKVRSDCTQTDIDVNKIDNLEDTFNDVPGSFIRDNVVLKKNKSESSLDSPDLEVSRLMNKKLTGSPFCDSSSSLEISGSSMESLALENQHSQPTKPIIIQQSTESDTELDRRKPDHITLSTESSTESTSEVPVNSNLLNMSVSSNESVSPIIFGKNKKLHGSLSSLEASVSSMDSARHDKMMVTSADSGIEYSLQHPTENKEDNSSNEGTLTNTSSFKENARIQEGLQDTLTSSPKRTSSLLDVPALKTKGLDRMRKISWVAPSSSFQVPKPEPEKVEMKPSHLEKLLSLFQHPTSLFSRAQSEEEKKSASNTPPRKDSSLTSSFWSWGSSVGKEREDKEDSSEATDSTLSERIQVSYVDESFSRKLGSKTPSTDTENTLSEFQSFPNQGASEASDLSQPERVTELTTDDNLVQKSLDLSVNNDNAAAMACDMIDLMNPNDLNKNFEVTGDSNKNQGVTETPDVAGNAEKPAEETRQEAVRPRSFAAVLKSSGSENSLEKPSPDSGQPVDKLPIKIIRGIKENISPENTLTSSMSNTKALALELSERQIKNVPATKAWDLAAPLDDALFRAEKDDSKAPIATIEETCDENADNSTHLAYLADLKFIDEKNVSGDSGVTSLEGTDDGKKETELGAVDIGKDALSYLIYENQDFEPDVEQATSNVRQENSLAQELKDAEVKEKLLDLSPELVVDEVAHPDPLSSKDLKGLRTSPVVPERAKLVKSNSLEHILDSDNPKSKTIAFTIPESTKPRDIPERRPKLRSRSGSSPKSLPESLNKQSPLLKLDSSIVKRKKKVNTLGKMARDSLLALNMSDEEIAEFRRSNKLTSVESLRSLESVSEDATSQSGASVDSRCRACMRISQESLMSLDSITEDCRCTGDCEKQDKAGRSVR